MFASWRYRAGDNTPLDPRIDLNFIDGSAFDERIAFTRASNAWDFDATGTLVQYAANTPRIAYDPVTLDVLGFHVEESRTNQVRNPRCEGAVAGSPGTMPTNWVASIPAGLSLEVVGSGSEDGIPYVDVRYFGTFSGAWEVQFDGAAVATAANGQTWTSSVFLTLVGGSTANISHFRMKVYEFPSAVGGTADFTPISAALSTQRVALIYATSQAGSSSVQNRLNFTSSGAIDFTLRIGVPQLELGAFATSPIMPPAGSPAASTRATETATINPIATWFQPDTGTLYAEATCEGLSSNAFLATLNDGTQSNEFRLFVNGGNGAFNAAVLNNGATVYNQNAASGSIQAGNVVKAAVSYGSQCEFGFNGQAIGPAAPAGTFPTIDRLQIGNRIPGAFLLDGYVRRIMYYPFALTAAQLQQITT